MHELPHPIAFALGQLLAIASCLAGLAFRRFPVISGIIKRWNNLRDLSQRRVVQASDSRVFLFQWLRTIAFALFFFSTIYVCIEILLGFQTAKSFFSSKTLDNDAATMATEALIKLTQKAIAGAAAAAIFAGIEWTFENVMVYFDLKRRFAHLNQWMFPHLLPLRSQEKRDLDGVWQTRQAEMAKNSKNFGATPPSHVITESGWAAFYVLVCAYRREAVREVDSKIDSADSATQSNET